VAEKLVHPAAVGETVTQAAREKGPAGSKTAGDLPRVDPKQFSMVREHARGGMGRVLAARDEVLERRVAIKELIAERGDAAARFLREAKVTARLQHPAIVPVYQAGRWPSGEPFYAMKMVTGRTLKDLIAAKPTLSERMSLVPSVLAVTDAVAYAHSEKVIHRDLKPANVLLGEFGETMLVDWGLAKVIGSHVVAKERLAPMARDQVWLWDPPMGITRLLQDGAAAAFSPDGGMLAVSRNDGSVGLCDGTGASCRALPTRLPGSAAVAFSPDGKSFLTAGADVRTWDVGTGQSRVLYAPTGASGGAFISPDLRWVVWPEKQTKSFVALDLASGERISHQTSLDVIVPDPLFSPAEPVFAWAVGDTVYLWKLADREVEQLGGLLYPQTARFSADGKSLVVGLGNDTIVVLDTTGVTPRIDTDSQGAEGYTVDVSRDGRVASNGYDGIIHIRDLSGGNRRALVGHRKRLTGLAFSPDGTTLASASEDRSLRIWDVATGDVRVLPIDEEVRALAFSPDGKRLLATSAKGTLSLFSLDHIPAPLPHDPRALHAEMDKLTSVVLTPDNVASTP
jgi:WD40 repeat protein